VTENGCLLCRVEDADAYFGRRRVWEDAYWRLSVVMHGAVVGFAHLEPHRHLPAITDLDGVEAVTLGPALARTADALRTAAEPTRFTCTCSATGCRTSISTWHRPWWTVRSWAVGGLVREGAPDIDPAVHRRVATAVADALAAE